MPRKRRQNSCFRSGFEKRVEADLRKREIKFGYEDTKLDYIIPASKHKYTPDFTLYLGDRIVYVESKGRLDPDARKKMLAVREAHPDVDLRILFQREQPIRKGSKTLYSDWARKNGFQFAFGDSIPEEWLSD